MEKNNDFQKFAPNSNSHNFKEELEVFLKKEKRIHYSLQALKQTAVDFDGHKRKATADKPYSQNTKGQPKSPRLEKRFLQKQTDNIWLQSTIVMSRKITEVTGTKTTHRFTDQPDSKP